MTQSDSQSLRCLVSNVFCYTWQYYQHVTKNNFPGASNQAWFWKDLSLLLVPGLGLACYYSRGRGCDWVPKGRWAWALQFASPCTSWGCVFQVDITWWSDSLSLQAACTSSSIVFNGSQFWAQSQPLPLWTSKPAEGQWPLTRVEKPSAWATGFRDFSVFATIQGKIMVRPFWGKITLRLLTCYNHCPCQCASKLEMWPSSGPWPDSMCWVLSK